MSNITGGNLELFETEFLQDFKNIKVTAIADYILGKNKSLLITGDSNGIIHVYERHDKKLTEKQQLQKGKSKIEKLLVISECNVLFILTGGSLFIYELPNLKDQTPKEFDGESRHLKDIAKIVENEDPKRKKDIMIITKKKKILFFYYNSENQRLFQKEYKDKDGKNLEIILKDIPEKIKWNGDNICYYLQNTMKLVYITIETNSQGKSTLNQNKQDDLPVEDIAFIQSNWVYVFTGGICLFSGTDGNATTKNPINLDQKDPMIELGIFNDLYIISLNQNSVAIYDYSEGQCVQEFTTDTTQSPFHKFLSKGQKGIFVVSIIKIEEKPGKDVYHTNLWELREFSFEEQIKFSLKYDQIEKAFGILNNKLEYNMEKFDFLESFYCDCGWNCFKKRNIKGFEEAEKYFSLCNFNPFELIYHFIKILDIKPIHYGYTNVTALSKEVNSCQFISDVKKDKDVAAAIKMLINTLKLKKRYLLGKNNLLNIKKDDKTMNLIETAKKTLVNFESSQNCVINLKDVEPKDITLEQVIQMINEVLVKSMVIMDMPIEEIENIFENDIFDTIYPEQFFIDIKNKNFKSDIVLVYIYRNNQKYNEAFNILEKYIYDIGKTVENKKSKTILQNILIGFGKKIDYTDEFEHGLRILLKDHYYTAFDIALSNELISIDNFIKILDDFDKANPGSNKKELFLKNLCENQKYANYSNDKYQTSYMELMLNKIFDGYKKDSAPPNEENNKDIIKKYKDFQKLFTTFTKYNKSHLLALIEESWMYDLILFLYTELQKYTEAIQKYIELVKSENKTFDNIRKYCQDNYKNDTDIFKKYFIILKNNYDDKEQKNLKGIFKAEMLKILELFIKGELLDEETKKNKNKLELLNILNPKEILSMIPDDWRLNEPLDQKDKSKTLFNLLRFYLKEYAVINNNYKRLENLAKMDLMYKKMKLYELRDKHVLLDINTSCYLCNKKIQNNTVFLVYPNGHIYHSGCSPDLHIEIKTGRNFENFDY